MEESSEKMSKKPSRGRSARMLDSVPMPTVATVHLPRTQELEHNKIKVGSKGYTNDQVYHVQTVNSKVIRLKTWIRDFNGVSTKYLQNYLNWFPTLEKLRDKALPFKTFSHLATTKAILLPELKIALLNHSYI